MAAPMPRAPPVTMATLSLSLIAAFPSSPFGAPGAVYLLLKVVRERRPHAARPQRRQRGRERRDIGRAVGEFAEDVAQGEKGLGIFARRLRRRLQPVPVRIVWRNDLAALRFAIGVAAPERGHEREAIDAG